MPTLASAPVLVFDSGVGGLSIFADIASALPTVPLAFACDNAAFPYGTKTETELLERVDVVLHALIARIQPRLVVVACNTASTVALPRLRRRFSLPIVGVVPAIKPAALISHNKVIGLLATPATVARPYTDELIREFAGNCAVIKVGSRELVELAEAKLRGATIAPVTLAPLLAPFFADRNHSADTIVLGCTHFPLLRAELAAATPVPVQWLDSGAAIARRVASLVAGLAAGPSAGTETAIAIATGTVSPEQALPAIAWMTADTADAQALWPALATRGFTDLQFVTI